MDHEWTRDGNRLKPCCNLLIDRHVDRIIDTLQNVGLLKNLAQQSRAARIQCISNAIDMPHELIRIVADYCTYNHDDCVRMIHIDKLVYGVLSRAHDTYFIRTVIPKAANWLFGFIKLVWNKDGTKRERLPQCDRCPFCSRNDQGDNHFEISAKFNDLCINCKLPFEQRMTLQDLDPSMSILYPPILYPDQL
jgi:hypothetical protein